MGPLVSNAQNKTKMTPTGGCSQVPAAKFVDTSRARIDLLAVFQDHSNRSSTEFGEVAEWLKAAVC